jgi:integrase
MARVDTAQLTSQIFTAGWRLALQPAVLANIYRQKDIMATIIQKQNKTIEIRFKDANGKSQSIYPGKIAKRAAQSIGSKIDHIVGRQIVGAEPDHEVAQWLAKLAENSGILYAKLVKKGLAQPLRAAEPAAEPDLAPTIRKWCDDYIAAHPGADRTIELLTVTARSLCHKFGDDKRIDTFNAGDAETYRKWLQTNGNERKKYKAGLALNTVRRTIGRCKQFFGSAVKHQLISRNPFDGEASAVTGNEDRLVLVPAEWIEKCIRKAPCEDWRIMLAFARYAGMRSHETRIQKWEDIDLANNEMLVRSHKTPPVRRCPIFPELRPHLLRAREHAPEGAELVVTRYDADANILTTMKKIVIKAGLVPWAKLMQNLRATRETELLAHYPAKDVTSWLGNSPEVANKHYAMTMQASFDRAIEEGAKIVGVTTAPPKGQTTAASATEPANDDLTDDLEVVDSKTPPNPPPTVQDKDRQSTPTKKADAKKPLNNWVCLASAIGDLATQLPRQDSHYRLKYGELSM